MKKLLLLALICALANVSFSQTNPQPSKLWMDKYTNEDYYASSYCIASDNLNHVYNAMYSDGTLLRAYDTAGIVLYSLNIDEISFPSDIVVDNDSGWLYICGSPDHSLCKIDKSNGSVIWVQTLNTNSSWGTSYAMTMDLENNVIIAGAESGMGYRIIKFNPEGDTLFDNTFALQVGDFPIPRDITCNSNNDIIVTGECGSGSGAAIALLKISSEGLLEWEVYDNSKSGANGVIVDQNNNIIITGSSAVNGTQFIHKYDIDGNNIWKKSGYENYCAFGLIEDAQGNYIVAGCHTTNLQTWEGEQSITCYSNSGEILWNHTEQDDFSHTAMAICKMANGNIALSGAIQNASFDQWAYSSVYEIIDIQMYSVTFVVVDNNSSEPVENAEVTFNGEVKNTNSDGIAIFSEILPNIYDFSISAIGYLIQEGNLTVLDQDVIKNVSILPDNIVEIQNQNLKIYPNPTKGELNIETNNCETKKMQYYISNVSGSVVEKGIINSNKTSLSLSNVSKGCYAFTLITEKGKLIKKVVLVD